MRVITKYANECTQVLLFSYSSVGVGLCHLVGYCSVSSDHGFSHLLVEVSLA